MNTYDYAQLAATELPNAQDYIEVVADLLGEPVMVTELLAGNEWAVTASRQAGRLPALLTIAQWGDRSRAVLDEQALFDCNLDYMLQSMMANAPKAVSAVTLRGVSIERNVYGREKQDVRLFDIEVNGEPLDAQQVFALLTSYAVPHVPVLTLPGQTLGQWLNRRSLPAAASGASRLYLTERRGIVIRTLTEQTHASVGRLMLKVRAG